MAGHPGEEPLKSGQTRIDQWHAEEQQDVPTPGHALQSRRESSPPGFTHHALTVPLGAQIRGNNADVVDPVGPSEVSTLPIAATTMGVTDG